MRGDTPFNFHIHINSNFPPTIIKELPKSIANHISNISLSEGIFENTTPIYEAALTSSTHKAHIKTPMSFNKES